jgi:spore germination cell wall hydrolase CwlJ-like protein
MKKIISIIVSVIALTVMAPGHAEQTKNTFIGSTVEIGQQQLDNLFHTLTTPWVTFNVTNKDEDCLARNIYYESGAESEEGKAAVGIVTINRVLDGRFGKSICSVVNQRTVFVRSKEVEKTEMVQTGFFGGPEPVTKKTVEVRIVPVCQFSWVCMFVRTPKVSNPQWEESKQVARELLQDGYASYRNKYANALYFHSNGVRPVWSKSKTPIAKVGGHTFYTDKS